MVNENEVPKHKKKKESGVSKSNLKSKHKHVYRNCLVRRKDYSHIMVKKYCEICGRLHSSDDLEAMCEVIQREAGRMYRMLDNEELLEKYPDYPVFKIDDIFQKYVTIVRSDENE